MHKAIYNTGHHIQGSLDGLLHREQRKALKREQDGP